MLFSVTRDYSAGHHRIPASHGSHKIGRRNGRYVLKLKSLIREGKLS